MAAPTSTTKGEKKENSSDLAELERRLLAGFASMIQKEIEPSEFASMIQKEIEPSGFASMIQKEIEPLKKDIKEIKEEQRNSVPSSVLDNCKAISRKVNQTDEKHQKLQDRISYEKCYFPRDSQVRIRRCKRHKNRSGESNRLYNDRGNRRR